MQLSLVLSRALTGISAPLVQVETHLSNGLPSFHIVGMPETAVRESKERVRSALINSHFEFPDRRITVNLAPADLPKEGGRFDLPIALGILAASGQLPPSQLQGCEFLGELALDGGLRSVPGVIPAAREATAKARSLVLPPSGAALAAYVPNSRIIPAPDILTLCAHLNQRQVIPPRAQDPPPEPGYYPDLSDVVGQATARRALEIAACGGHNLLFYGPPGTGKTLLASRMPGILPPPDISEALDSLALRNIRSTHSDDNWLQRPFRNPHHSASAAALGGGGGNPLPGEVSLAHGGVLFLDELPEFKRQCLEMLREPMESGQITLSRARYKTTYPARFQLIAAMNPCPCGYSGDREIPCRCSPDQISNYRQRISGPLLDRIDMHIGLSRIPAAAIVAGNHHGEASKEVRRRVIAGREAQIQRQQCNNTVLDQRLLSRHCGLCASDQAFLTTALERMKLSPRAIHRSLRVARTIADLAGEEQVSRNHLGEALAYRNPDLAT
ncbi:MAG: YifB family Mg chelatase-like AAA ATPase [Halioglobus sp.]